ncbi:SCP-like extracellular protein, putative [Ketogulonicigenium robustum]|uniref:SCP-like extracellular protein, putative n=1 Tax=Ketogulonicigenium robustum TaxID=92947 RepID=A0A1W6P2Q4_9RHOB|nr:CAP domain-containing protein [Ketogulonicigenium robustum]ARO15671.1 SCP-like extracellular protein, putative [Ketogulonicigenium robustum]
MLRRAVLSAILLSTVAACATGNTRARIGPDGLPLPTVYRINSQDAAAIPFRMLDGVNTLRAARGVPAVQLDAQLNAAAATHSRDMAIQNRPWHFGSDGSSPLDRLRRVGYSGQLIGEAISESYENEMQTLSVWMEDPDIRDVILDPSATRMGVAWLQEDAGKIWWTMVIAR